jgi:hypothetical protein
LRPGAILPEPRDHPRHDGRTDQRPDHQRKDRDHRNYKHYASHITISLDGSVPACRRVAVTEPTRIAAELKIGNTRIAAAAP